MAGPYKDYLLGHWWVRVPFVDKSASTNQLKTERTNAYDVKHRLGLGPYISRNTTSRSRAAYVLVGK